MRSGFRVFALFKGQFLGGGVIRFLLELMGTDPTFRFLGLSRNGWVSIGVVLLGVLVVGWKELPWLGDRDATRDAPSR